MRHIGRVSAVNADVSIVHFIATLLPLDLAQRGEVLFQANVFVARDRDEAELISREIAGLSGRIFARSQNTLVCSAWYASLTTTMPV